MVSERIGSPGWGYAQSFQYQSGCLDCRVLFVHRHEKQFLCKVCAVKRRYE